MMAGYDNGTERITIAWLKSFDKKLDRLDDKLDLKADKADVEALTTQVEQLQSRVHDDELTEGVIGRRRRRAKDGLKWLVGIAAVVLSGLIGSLVH